MRREGAGGPGVSGHSPAPANGEMGGVVPSGEAGGVLAALLGDDGYPAGRLIMMLRVTLTGVSSLPDAGDGGTKAAASPAGSVRPTGTKRSVRSKGTTDTRGCILRVFSLLLRRRRPPRSPLIFTAAGRTGCLRRRPRPVSGRGPATVSSHSLSRRPIPLPS